MQKNLVLAVDVDGTLIHTDLLMEALMMCARTTPWILLLAPIWLLKGRGNLKRKLAQRFTDLNWAQLPYNRDVVFKVQQAKQNGTRTVLATASDQIWAEAIAQHVGSFDEVLGSDGVTNLKGSRKCELLVQKYGLGQFAYIGDHPADLKIWSHAGEAIVVNPSARLLKRVRQVNQNITSLGEPIDRMRAVIKAIRPHQWVKNILIFVPLVMAHQFLNAHLILRDVIAFLAFSIAASSGYLINDLFDLHNDRAHRSKKSRPLASGTLFLPHGILLALGFLFLSVALASLLGPYFSLLILTYLVMTLFYSFRGKQLLLIDVLLLAALYTLRFFAGSIATDVPLSHWLLAFSMFVFLSLALVKRYSELLIQRQSGNHAPVPGRSYQALDLEAISSFGCSCATVAVLVLAFYVTSEDAKHLYATPVVLWGLCPLTWYWMMRVWIHAHRGLVDEDPIVFALKDKMTYFVGLVVMLLFILAKGVL